MSIYSKSIALVGRLGSGKSTAARALQQIGWERHSWAEGVRSIFSMAYDTITPENYAEIKAKTYTVMENGVLVYRTGRELLQRIGTDAMRDNVDERFWITAGLKRLSDVPTVNDDTRFLNEAAALHLRGFTLVRVVRPGFDEGGGTGTIVAHASEVEQDRIEVDHTILNDGSIEALAAKVRFIAQGGMEGLKGSRMAAQWGPKPTVEQVMEFVRPVTGRLIDSAAGLEIVQDCNCPDDWPEHSFDCPLFHVPR